MTRRTVAVVGGGCSGVLVARELLRCTGDEVVLIEPGEPGGGLAYGAARPWHLLNSRAGAMSADPDDPGHFARWAGAEPHEFRSRPEYGRYLREVFAETAARYADRLDVRADRATAVGPDGTVGLAGGDVIHADNVVLATGNPAAAHPARAAGLPTRDHQFGAPALEPPNRAAEPAGRETRDRPGRAAGREMRDQTGGPAGREMLDRPGGAAGRELLDRQGGAAGRELLDRPGGPTGREMRDRPGGAAGRELLDRPGGAAGRELLDRSAGAAGREMRDHPDYVADPWRPSALDQIPADAPVLLVGAGLTAIDVALTLTADGRRNAPITAVSRRGQLPLSHTVAAAPPAAPDLDDCATLRDVVRAVRAEASRAGDWRAVVDGLRPRLDELWVAFTPDEQEAFLRHLARPWECHRHRMAPSVAARVADLRHLGLLEVRAGGIRSIEPIAAGGLHVELEAGRQWFGAVVNCAGPGRLPGAAGPLVRGLLDTGVARVGPHGLGLDIDRAGRLVGAGGVVRERLWLLGPLRRGAQWETTAVPEIRAQARRLATDLASVAPVAAAA